MGERIAYILDSSADGKRHICIDKENESAILDFLKEDEARIKKFKQIKDLILRNIRNPELYGKENINSKCKNVTAIKMFKGSQNIRIYCKEQTSSEGTFYVIISEFVPKKKDQKVKGKIKNLIEKVAKYEYRIVEREK